MTFMKHGCITFAFPLILMMALMSYPPSIQAADESTAEEVRELKSTIIKLQQKTFDLQDKLDERGISDSDKERLKKVDTLVEELKALNADKADKATATVEISKAVPSTGVSLEAVSLSTTYIWLLVAGFLVMLMQAGFGLVEIGFTRAKNAAHTMSLNLLDYSVGMLAFWMFGFAIMFGGMGENAALGIGPGQLDSAVGIESGDTVYTFFGTSGWFLSTADVIASDGTLHAGIFTFFLFQMVFASTANTIPTGTLTERWRLRGFMVSAFFVAGLIYPVFGHWVWGGGWLSALGFVDFAGSTVVHMAGGVLALVGAWLVGPRVGKFNADGTPNPIPGHNLPMAFVGTFILAFGWFGFNAGSTLSGNDGSMGVIAVNTALAAGAGAVAAAFLSKIKFGKPDPSFSCNGMLGGLVGITAPCAFVDPWAAVVIGLISGTLVVLSALVVEDNFKLDDPVGAISVHGTCGAFGGLAVGIFGNGRAGVEGLLYGGVEQIGPQVLGVVVCFVYFSVAGWILFTVSNILIGNRASDEDQMEGLDLAEMGVEAYAPEDEY